MNSIDCPICRKPLSVKVAKGRKSNKPFIMLVCSEDGRHFRGFITDQPYVKKILEEQRNNTTGTGKGEVAIERDREHIL